MALRPDEPGRTGLGPDQSDTPPDDLPDLRDVPDGRELPEDEGRTGTDDPGTIGADGADISGPVPGDD
jgi:hypothetical protein